MDGIGRPRHVGGELLCGEVRSMGRGGDASGQADQGCHGEDEPFCEPANGADQQGQKNHNVQGGQGQVFHVQAGVPPR